MEATLKRNKVNFGDKIIAVLALFGPSNIQKSLYEMFDNIPNDSSINYIGELNKNDVMH